MAITPGIWREEAPLAGTEDVAAGAAPVVSGDWTKGVEAMGVREKEALEERGVLVLRTGVEVGVAVEVGVGVGVEVGGVQPDGTRVRV